MLVVSSVVANIKKKNSSGMFKECPESGSKMLSIAFVGKGVSGKANK